MISKDIKKLLENLNPFCSKLFEGAVGACVARTHYEVGIPHLLAQMVEDERGDSHHILVHFGIEKSLLRQAIQQELRDFKSGNTGRPTFSPAILELLERSLLESTLNLNSGQIRSAAILLALRESLQMISPDLQQFMRLIPTDQVHAKAAEILEKSVESQMATAPAKSAKAATQGGSQGSHLEQFTINFTEQARNGKIDPIFGRDDEIRQAIDILSRRRKNNPIFIGEAGVGKTAIVEGMALKVVEGNVPEHLKGIEILGIDLGLLSAGAGVRGEFENRLKGILKEVKESATPIVLFIDEAHTLIGAGGEAGKNDAANLLKPELARGEIKCMAATTFSEFRKYFEKDPAMARRFQSVVIPEPTPEQAAIMLRGLRERYENYHGVRVSHQAVLAACEMSSRYIAGRQLPDKAVDLLDTACARVKMSLNTQPQHLQQIAQELLNIDLEIQSLEKDQQDGSSSNEETIASLVKHREELVLQQKELETRWQQEMTVVTQIHAQQEKFAQGEGQKEDLDTLWQKLEEVQSEGALVHTHVTPEVVATIIEEWTGIPAGNMVADEAQVLLNLSETINQRVIGQSWGITEMVNTIQSAKMQLTRPETPLGVFLVTGPSGVGKTEVAKSIADLLFGGEKFVTTLSMSEYQDSISITQLKGASAGYVGYGDGGVLTEGVRKRPYTVVILDEIEKAHKDVLNMFYQVFDQGTLRDGEGRDINFRNTIIIMTSNLGTHTITEMALDSENSYTYEEYTEAITPELTEHFQPALLARCKVVPFLPLGSDSLSLIAQLKLDKIARRLEKTHQITMACSPELIDHLVSQCNLVQSGARLIDSIIDKDILPRISSALLQEIASGNASTHLFIGISETGHPTFHFSQGGFEA